MKPESLLAKMEYWEKVRWGRIPLFLLEMASYAYGSFMRVRSELYKFGLLPADEVNCRVVCIGNLTCGGAGKTPMVIHLAQTLSQQGLRVAVISRGYKGKLQGNLTVVSDGEKILESAERVGDEPYLIAQQLPQVPVIIGRRRWRAAVYAHWRFNPQIIIMDDGYQHLKLRRNVDILLLDAHQPFGTGHLLPRGTMREFPADMDRAHVIVITRAESAMDLSPLIQKVRSYNPGAILLTSNHLPQDLQNLADKSTLPLDWLSGKKVLGFCGIAQPMSFRKTLEGLGAEVVEFKALPDHYEYQKEKLAEIQELAELLKVEAMVTTEKDAAKMPSLPGNGDLHYLSLRISLQITSDEQKWQEALGMIRGVRSQESEVRRTPQYSNTRPKL